MTFYCRIIVFACLSLVTLTSHSEPYVPAALAASDYDRAAALLSINIKDQVKNPWLSPHWFSDSKSFWYRKDTDQGGEYLIVDAQTGAQKSAFNHKKLAKAVSKVTDIKVSPDTLLIRKLAYQPELVAEVGVPSGAVRCTIKNYRCESVSPWMLDPFQMVSPTGNQSVFIRDHNLWLRDLMSGKESRLTTDGKPDYAWAAMPGWGAVLQMMRLGIDGPVVGSSWSPDGRYLVAPKVDERKVGKYLYFDSIPADASPRPRVWEKSIALVGDEHRTEFEMRLFDTRTGNTKPIPLADDCTGELGAFPPQVLWHTESDDAYLICIAPDASKWELIAFNLQSGTSKTVFQESADTYLELNHSLYQSLGANVRILKGGREAVVFSQRSNYGHLYRIDLRTGEVINAISEGEWVVQDIVHLDEQGGWIYFTAGGREPGRNPYWRHVYRAQLDGSELELLTPEAADHAVTVAAAALLGAASTFSPDGNYFIDNASTVSQPTEAMLRRADGSVVSTVVEADADALFKRGFEPPLEFKVKAADGETDIYGVIYAPKNRKTGMKYPVIEHIYGGPQTNITPRTFSRAAGVERVGGQGDTSVMTELGFALVMMDVRGTPWRSKTFHDFTWRKHHEFAIEDHVAALKQLEEQYPWLDLERVGITGHSWGGYSSALAMLRFPDFYKVAVSSAGPYDYSYLYPAFTKWTGWPEYADGGRIAPSASAKPVNFIPHANLIDNLKGDLLIIYGEHDENTLPASTIAFIDALIKADKDFDLLVLPNRDHFYTNETYFTRKRWDYFVEHLMDAAPPKGYSIPTE